MRCCQFYGHFDGEVLEVLRCLGCFRVSHLFEYVLLQHDVRA